MLLFDINRCIFCHLDECKFVPFKLGVLRIGQRISPRLIAIEIIEGNDFLLMQSQ